MKFRVFAFLLSMIFIFSCADTPRPAGQQEGKEDRKPSKTKPASSYPDTIIINSPSAVFYTPDSLQLEKIKAITEPAIFESTMHECFYQMRNSRIVLKQYYAGIRIIEVKNARYLLFTRQNGKKEYIDLDAQNDPCGIILFDTRKAPRPADMTNIETELGFYFSQ
ncbi:MAG TPA: hypothetical protein VIZ28_07580 [Chitinophagaceae bacterium]